MSKVKVAAFAVSLDGFGAGPNQSLENPLGTRGTELHNWFFKTKVFQKMHGNGDGIESALKKAKTAAKGEDIRIGGGVYVIREYLKAGLIDELHLVHSPVFLGSGENLFSGIDIPNLGFSVTEKVETADATHIVLNRTL